MNSRQNEFERLVNRAVRDSKLSHMRNAIEKELLIYSILFCLEQQGLLDSIVFQGGTLLRLGHGGERFSEDLDFVAGVEFSPSDLDAVKPTIENFLYDRFGLAVEVKEPNTAARNIESSGIEISRWQVKVIIHPERREIPRQRIKIEVANVPAHTREIIAVRTHYDFLPDGYDDVLIVAETLNEVMADKLISLPATTRYVRYRDIWDLYWLKKRRATVNAELIERKLSDYQLAAYEDLLNKTIKKLPDIVSSPMFQDEMQRLLPSDVFDRSLRKAKFGEHLLSSVQGLFEQVSNSLKGTSIYSKF